MRTDEYLSEQRSEHAGLLFRRSVGNDGNARYSVAGMFVPYEAVLREEAVN